MLDAGEGRLQQVVLFAPSCHLSGFRRVVTQMEKDLALALRIENAVDQPMQVALAGNTGSRAHALLDETQVRSGPRPNGCGLMAFARQV